MRTNTHDLPKRLRTIVEGVSLAPFRLETMQLRRKFGGADINRLIDRGYLAEVIAGRARYVDLTPLARHELDRPRPWTKIEDQLLSKEWPANTRVSAIARALNRSASDVMARAAHLGLERKGRRWRRFAQAAPAWKTRRLRVALVEAERRGIDFNDDGAGLMHVALQKRFLRARRWATTLRPRGSGRWRQSEYSALRGFRDAGKSILRMSQLLDRHPTDIVHSLQVIGRSVDGTWTPAEDKIIADGVADGASYSKIAKRLAGRDIRQVTARAAKLCASHQVERVAWTGNEIQPLLRGAALGLRGRALTQCVPTRGHHAVRRKFYKLTRDSRGNDPWSEVDFAILVRAMYREESAAEIAKWLDRRVEDVETKLAYFTERRIQRGRKRKLTDDQVDEALKLEAEGHRLSQIAPRYKVTAQTLRRAMRTRQASDADPAIAQLVRFSTRG